MSTREKDDEPLAACTRLLEALAASPERFAGAALESPLGQLRAAASRLVAGIREACDGERERHRLADRRASRQRRVDHDRALVETTGIRRLRDEVAPPLVALPLAREASAPSTRLLARSRTCYVCKQRFRHVHAFYDAMCPECARFNFAKREQTADLTGRVALVTGGRMKIGHHIVLKLLRAGAQVIVTTRFPCDAARRFAAAVDFADWRQRLTVHGLDLRHLAAVEGFATAVAATQPHLDIVVHNAAQTVRRPPAYYDHLLDSEYAGPDALPDGLGALVHPAAHHATRDLPTLAASLSQLPLLADDAAGDSLLFPPGRLARDGQPLDRREQNSWSFLVDEVSRFELLEVHHVNAFAPFLLLQRLLPLLLRSPRRDRFIVNVSAMEGKFDYDGKQPNHPHTNMAKAALNMLTRTIGPQLASAGVHMNSVDTGWVTNEHPLPVAERMSRSGFEPPLDEIDGAARVLDPIFDGVTSGEPASAHFLKDYRPTTW